MVVGMRARVSLMERVWQAGPGLQRGVILSSFIGASAAIALTGPAPDRLEDAPSPYPGERQAGPTPRRRLPTSARARWNYRTGELGTTIISWQLRGRAAPRSTIRLRTACTRCTTGPAPRTLR